jgi:hypothetical protein
MSRTLTLVIHQLSATFGVILWAAVLTGALLQIPRLWGHVFYQKDVYFLLSGSPYFPIEVSVGLMWGWLVGGQFRQRAALWVWVFPLFALCWALLEAPATYTSIIIPGAELPVYTSKLSHFFGRGCRLEDRCIDEFGITLPFYTSVAYSVGVFLANRLAFRSRLGSNIQFCVLLATGVLLLADTVFGLVRMSAILHGPWKWILLPSGTIEAGMGTVLILFALRMRRKYQNLIIAPLPPAQ